MKQQLPNVQHLSDTKQYIVYFDINVLSINVKTESV